MILSKLHAVEDIQLFPILLHIAASKNSENYIKQQLAFAAVINANCDKK